MDPWICRKYFILIMFLLISAFQINESAKLGHYRCAWQIGPAPSSVKSDITTSGYKADKPMCSSEDSSRITSFVNHCSNQNYVPLLACRDDGTWNCQSFIAMCKTLIHTESKPQNHGAEQSPDSRRQMSELSATDLQRDSVPAADPESKMFNPDENYFTMKEMAIAVLVSFITGATMLAIVICVVWRCRNSHMTSEQAREAAHHSAKRLAALHAITHIAHAIGGGQDSSQGCHFTNPQYGQIIASRDILGDALTEHDRVYEEIFTRRKSSCKNPECIYATVDKPRKKSSAIRKNRSAGDLRTIDESAEESDYGYEADSNVTPQVPRRKINNFSNVVNNYQKSPALNARRYNENTMSDDIFKTSMPYMNCVRTSSGKRCKEPENSQAGADIENEISKDEVSKCDSGFMEEISESGHAIVQVGCETGVDIDNRDDASTRIRKQSLRM